MWSLSARAAPVLTGEIPCGYADGCLTREQTILVAYHRGRMAPEHGVTGGLMAAVGLSADAADARLRKEGLTLTVVGCDNSPVNVTLAGAPLGFGRVCRQAALAPAGCAESWRGKASTVDTSARYLVHQDPVDFKLGCTALGPAQQRGKHPGSPFSQPHETPFHAQVPRRSWARCARS